MEEYHKQIIFRTQERLMAKSYNYATNLLSSGTTTPRYRVSRIIDNPRNGLLETEIPSDIPETFTVEMLVYSLRDNSLITSILLDNQNEDIFSVKTLVYSDTSVRKILFIDFSSINLIIEEGRFQVVLNFFVPEIGSYNEPILMLTDTSPSRKEVELSLLPQYKTPENIRKLSNFASPQISSEWVDAALRQIFNQPSSSISNNIPTDTSSMTYKVVESFLPAEIVVLINNPNTSGEFTSSVKTSIQSILNFSYGFATQSIRETGSSAYTDKILYNLVSSSIVRGVQRINPATINAFSIL